MLGHGPNVLGQQGLQMWWIGFAYPSPFAKSTFMLMLMLMLIPWDVLCGPLGLPMGHPMGVPMGRPTGRPVDLPWILSLDVP